jgi:hypothetical protein
LALQAHVKDALYNVHDPARVAADQVNLTEKQLADLAAIFERRALHFSGRIGCYTKRKFHIELKPGTVPYVKKLYHISIHNIPANKREMERLQESIGILEHCWETKWGLAGFIRPKKDGTFQTIKDMRKLNKCVVPKVYPLLCI